MEIQLRVMFRKYWKVVTNSNYTQTNTSTNPARYFQKQRKTRIHKRHDQPIIIGIQKRKNPLKASQNQERTVDPLDIRATIVQKNRLFATSVEQEKKFQQKVRQSDVIPR